MQTEFRKYESSDSVAFLGRQLSDIEEDHVVATAPLTVAVSIRRFRLLLLTTIVLAVIAVTVLALQRGVELTEFLASSKNATTRSALLDDYNSYSGNVASAFGKPIEIFVAVVTQLVVLRYMAHTYTQPTISRRQFAVRLALSVVVGYLISNGLNAVNVQFDEDEVRPIILPSDLSLSSTLSGAVEARTTTFTKTISEMTPGNLVSNTVLRNLVLPRVTVQQEICKEKIYTLFTPFIQLPAVEFGFPQRDWQNRLLQEAPPAKTLKVIVNATDKTVNKPLRIEDLPMNASLAADLFLNAMFAAPSIFPWGWNQDFLNWTSIKERHPTRAPDQGPLFQEKMSILTGLLPPPSREMDELVQRDWFLKAMQSAVSRQFTRATNTSRRDIGVEFAHVAISPSINFDAVTIEVEIDPMLLATAANSDNATWFTQVNQAVSTNAEPGSFAAPDCGPWPGLCAIKRDCLTKPLAGYSPYPPQQVQVYGICLTSQGEEMTSRIYGAVDLECNKSSTSSFMTMAIGRRLNADSLVQTQADDTSNNTDTFCKALITNLRSIYTFTIGRLSWQLENLTEIFGAECGTQDTTHACLGLHVELASTTLADRGRNAAKKGNQPQGLILGSGALPIVKAKPRLQDSRPTTVSLVQVNEYPFETTVSRDILLPHNIGKTVWSNETVRDECDAELESLFYNSLNNHIYIEHGLQTAYTAATFYLFQNAVVKDVIPKGGDATATTLNFDGNTQSIIAKVSTPSQNAMLTLVGCGVFFLFVLATVVKPRTAEDPLASITEPQAVARVMLDDNQFPSMLLHRRVLYSRSGEEVTYQFVDKLQVSHLGVVHEDDIQKETVGSNTHDAV